MAEIKDVTVVIDLLKASPRASTGYPLIFASSATAEVAYTEVSGLGELLDAGIKETDAIYKAASLLFMQDKAPSTIAVCASKSAATTGLASVLEEGWRQLIVVGDDDVEGVSDYIEASGKHAVYFASCAKAEYATLATAIKGNERTVVVVYDSTDVSNPEAALVGASAGMDAGSFTYKNLILKGVTPQKVTASEVAAMHEAGVITIVKKAGDIVSSEGVTLSGEYVDIVDSKDYIIDQIEFQTQKVLNRLPKVPYDDTGIATLESVTYSVLKDAANKGMVAYDVENEEYLYGVDFGKRSECAASDISSRHYELGRFEFELAGAIHTAKVTGSILA